MFPSSSKRPLTHKSTLQNVRDLPDAFFVHLCTAKKIPFSDGIDFIEYHFAASAGICRYHSSFKGKLLIKDLMQLVFISENSNECVDSLLVAFMNALLDS